MKKIFILLMAVLVIFVSVQSSFAITPDEESRIGTDSEFHDPSQCVGNGSSTSGTSTVAPGSGGPTGSQFPNLDPTGMANAINTWISQQNPSSELSGLGSTIVASAKNSNVSPFLIVAIAHEESSLSSPSDFNVSHGNNSFGREAGAGQPSFQGSRAWYKWSSVKASVDYTAPENQGAVGGGDMATYLRDEYGSKIDANDLTAVMEAYAPPSENNTTQYIANLNSWISALVGLTTGGGATVATTTTTPSNNTSGCGCTGSSGTSSIANPSAYVDLADAQAIAQASGVQVGFAVSDSSGNIIASYQGDQTEPSASITKAMLLVAYLRQAGASTPTGAEDAQLTAMIENSDNSAADATFQQVGAAAVQKVATDAGMTNFSLTTTDPLYVLGESRVTANDQAKFFAKINTLIPAPQLSYAQNLMSHLASTDQWGILSDGLPATIYSKAGWKQEPPTNNWVLNQGAQVVPNNGGPAIGVAVISFGSTTQQTGEQLAQNITTKLLSPLSSGGSSSSCSSGNVTCNSPNSSTSGLTPTRQNVVCIAQQQLTIWEAQPGYPWKGDNTYSATGYLSYSQGRHEEWCADFASWVYDQAKYPLRTDPAWNIAYVPNIQAVGQQNQNFHWHPEASYTPKPGDLAIYGSQHVNIVTAVQGTTVTFIGGDQGHGDFPGGSIVSTYQQSGFHAGGITGFVSPD